MRRTASRRVELSQLGRDVSSPGVWLWALFVSVCTRDDSKTARAPSGPIAKDAVVIVAAAEGVAEPDEEYGLVGHASRIDIAIERHGDAPQHVEPVELIQERDVLAVGGVVTQSCGIGRFTRRSVFWRASATVNMSDGDGLRSGELRSNSARIVEGGG